MMFYTAFDVSFSRGLVYICISEYILSKYNIYSFKVVLRYM